MCSINIWENNVLFVVTNCLQALIITRLECFFLWASNLFFTLSRNLSDCTRHNKKVFEYDTCLNRQGVAPVFISLCAFSFFGCLCLSLTGNNMVYKCSLMCRRITPSVIALPVWLLCKDLIYQSTICFVLAQFWQSETLIKTKHLLILCIFYVL